jgi:CRP-like cAMP-binding protein
MSVGDDSSVPRYGFGEKPDHSRSGESTKDIIYEHGDAVHVVHSSTLAAGKEGCVVLVFPKTSLIPFLDEYPGLLLSLLGTQVVV